SCKRKQNKPLPPNLLPIPNVIAAVPIHFKGSFGYSHNICALALYSEELAKKKNPYLYYFKPSWSTITNNENTVFPLVQQQYNNSNNVENLYNLKNIVVPNYNFDTETHDKDFNYQHLMAINAYEEIIASLISSIPQSEIADLCNIQLLNLQKFSTYIPTTIPLNLPYDQYMGYYQLADNINEIICTLIPTTNAEIDSIVIDTINGTQLP
ncbi:1985_t:CDS:2, partial [Gigaspora margarita]